MTGTGDRASARPAPGTEGPDKVTGAARYAVEYPVDGRRVRVAGAGPGRPRAVTAVDTGAGARDARRAGRALARQRAAAGEVVDHELLVFQATGSPTTASSSPRGRRQPGGGPGGGRLVAGGIDEQPHDTELRADQHDLYTPEKVNPNYAVRHRRRATWTPELAAERGARSTSRTRPPATHNNPMEPHAEHGPVGRRAAARARLQPGRDRRRAARWPRCSARPGAGPGGHRARRRRVRRQGHAAAATWCSPRWRPGSSAGRCELALTRQQHVQRWSATAPRRSSGSGSAPTPTGGCRDRPRGDRADLDRHASSPSRPRSAPGCMYAAPHRRTDAPARPARRADAVLDARPRRGARACTRWSPRSTSWPSPVASTRSSCGCATSRRSTPRAASRSPAATSSPACARAPRRFGWAGRGPAPRRRAGRALAGRHRGGRGDLPGPRPAGLGRGRDAAADGRFQVGSTPPTSAPAPGPCSARSPPTRSACRRTRVEIRDRRQRRCRRRPVAGGSMGTASWGWAVIKAAPASCAARTAAARARGGRRGRVDTTDESPAQDAHWPGTRSARTSPRCGWTRTPARYGCPGCSASSRSGRVVNPRTARSQFLGGMTMGLAMALPEETRDGPPVRRLRQPRPRRLPRAGLRRRRHRDRGVLAGRARTRTSTRSASRASGRSASSGPPAAIGNAVRHATGVRVRDLPIRLDKVLFR